MEAGPDAALMLGDRRVVGQRLADRLRPLRSERPVILAIPRGGVPVGYEMSRSLGAEFDLIVALELSIPDDPRKALGAVAEFGGKVISQDRVEASEHSTSELELEAERVMGEIARRSRMYRGERTFPELQQRTVVVVTDGVVEPLTARAALRGVWSREPRRVIFATGVMSRQSRIEIRRDAGEVIALREPEYLFSVAEWYRDLPPVSDEEIQQMLHSTVPGLAP
jgi:putative phosphoribosyl transferase